MQNARSSASGSNETNSEFRKKLEEVEKDYEYLVENYNRSNHAMEFQTLCNELNIIREKAWMFLRNKCPSFSAMDSRAQFSEIFHLSAFENLSDSEKSHEKSKLISTFDFSGICGKRNLMPSGHSEIFVNYITLSDVQRLNLPPSCWPHL